VAIDVVTRGKTPIDTIQVEDVIPPSFKNPVKEGLKIFILDKEIPADDISLRFDPEGDDMINAERKMIVNVKDILENIGELEDESTISVKYPLIAFKPPKEATYDAPVLFQAYTKPAGAPIEAFIKPETITVEHLRRRTTVGKSIQPGATKSDFDIVLIYKNKGDSAKSDITISDFVPKDFTITKLEKVKDIDAKQVKDKTGIKLTWTFKEIAANEEIEIMYSIHGEGDAYSLKDVETKAFR